jgi:uncharacterized membrane protein
MRTRAKRRVTARFTWDRLKVSFWFAPLVMSAAAILLAWAMYWVDVHIPNELLQNNRLILAGSVSELRTVLITIATTTLATAGVVFTLLTLPLSTVAAQYGSRLLRVFLGDRITQLVLGMFVATFVYCISAATSLPAETVQFEAPQVTATVGLLLMLATFASLILLVQHISTMLQAPNIAAAAGAELLNVVRAEIPDEIRSGADHRPSDQQASDILVETEGSPVRVRDTGYIQYIDPEYVLTLVKERDLVIRLLHKPGHFVSRGEVVALVWPADRFDEQLEGQIGHAFQIGNGRSPTQDVEYAVNQLVEMAVRAMSPAINDPFTAMTCLDHVGNGLALFIQQGEKSSHYYDRDGRLRLVLKPVTFDELLSAAFDMLRHASCDNASVLLHMLTAIDTISQEAKSPEDRQQLLRHVNLIQAESHAGALIERDRQSIHLRVEALQTKLQGSP